MLIAHITDPHIGLDTSQMPGYPGAEEAFRRALRHVRNLSPAPRVLLLSGDLTDDGQVQDYETLLAIMKAELPEQADNGPLVLAVPGNHDDPATARRMLGNLMPVASDAPAELACVHVAHGGLHFIGLDTVQPGHPYGAVTQAQLDWLEKQLEGCADEPVVIFMHHPPLVTGMTAMDACGLLQGAAPLGRLVASHGGVQVIAAGHMHRPVMGALGGAPVVVAPSSSHQLELNLRPGAPLACRLEPPMIGLYRWAPEDGIACHLSHVESFAGTNCI